MAHESISDVTMGTETAVDQEVDALGPHYVKRLLAGRPFYIAHRMGGTEFPENTRQGLDASLRAGFKALEVSVRRCASGEFVAIHDWKTTRTVPENGLPDLEHPLVDAAHAPPGLGWALCA